LANATILPGATSTNTYSAFNARRFGQRKAGNHILAQVVIPAERGRKSLQVPLGFLDADHVRLRTPHDFNDILKADVRPAPLNIEGHHAQWNNRGRLRCVAIIRRHGLNVQCDNEKRT
jgi:hypothetical protein